MKKNNLAILLPLLVILGCKNTPPADSDPLDNSAAIAARIDSIAQAYLDGGQLAGFAIAVLRDGDTL